MSVSPGLAGGVGLFPWTVKATFGFGVTVKVSEPSRPLMVIGELLVLGGLMVNVSFPLPPLITIEVPLIAPLIAIVEPALLAPPVSVTAPAPAATREVDGRVKLP